MAIGLWMCASKSSTAQSPVSLQSGDIQTQKVLKVAQEAAFNVSQVTNTAAPQFVIDKRAITVIGQGQATAPADTALLEFRFASRTPFQPPQAGATPSLAQETASLPGEEPLKPVVDALVAIQVPAENIQIQTSTLENPKLLVKVNKPTRERVQEVVRVASSALQNSQTLFLQGISAEYAVNNCQPLERAARRAALRDAETQVKSVALEMGIQLGELLFVTVYPMFSPATVASCGTKIGVPVSVSLGLTGMSESTPPYNPSAPTEVQMRTQVGITYAIK